VPSRRYHCLSPFHATFIGNFSAESDSGCVSQTLKQPILLLLPAVPFFVAGKSFICGHVPPELLTDCAPVAINGNRAIDYFFPGSRLFQPVFGAHTDLFVWRFQHLTNGVANRGFFCSGLLTCLSILECKTLLTILSIYLK